jgi:hypothetical protein
MPSTEFYITDDERMELFDYVTNNDGVFVPDLWYNKPEGIRIQSKMELITCIDALTIAFYVISSRFQIEPLMFKGFGKDEEQFDEKRQYVTEIPWNRSKKQVLKIDDGLSHHLTKIGMAKEFRYKAIWTEKIKLK